MATLYLHVGSQDAKTASLQKFLSNNAGLLEARGIAYPSEGLEGMGHDLVARCCGLDSQNPDKARLRSLCQSIVSNLSHNQTRIIMSSAELESIPNIMPLKILSEYFDVKIVFYVQRQDDYLESMYEQYVVSYGLRFVGSIYQFMLAHNFFIRCNYNNQVSRWENHFGRENVILRLCKTQNGYKDVCADFLSVVGESSASVNALTSIRDRVISFASLPYISHINQLSLGEQQHDSIVESVNASRSSEERLYLLRWDDRMSFYEKFEQSNRLLFERYQNKDSMSFDEASLLDDTPRWINHERVDIQQLLQYVDDAYRDIAHQN